MNTQATTNNIVNQIDELLATTPEDQAALELSLVNEAVSLQAQAEQIKERLDEIKIQLINKKAPGTHTIGDHKVQIRAGVRRLSSTRLAKDFPAETFPQLYKNSFDTAAVKNEFAPAALEQYYDIGAPVVSFK